MKYEMEIELLRKKESQNDDENEDDVEPIKLEVNEGFTGKASDVLLNIEEEV